MSLDGVANMSVEDSEPLPKVIAADDAQSLSEPKGAADDNKFQQAIAAWRSLDLTSLMTTLDTAASDLVSHQRDSLVQRKELAQKTKDFRKLDDAAKLAEIKTILKAYQSFIDLITNQSKSTQAAFLQIYSPLSDAPDPYPLLEASVDSIIKSEEVIPKLEAENKHLQDTVAKLNQQLEEQDAQLEQERAARQSSATTRDSKIKDIEESWRAVLKEKQDNWEAREKSLEDKVENQDRLLKDLKASYEVSQRMHKAGEDGAEHLTVSTAELDILNSELDRANQRMADLEARNEQLSLDLAQSIARAGQSSRSAPVEEDPSFLRLRSENSTLLRKLDAARFEKDSDKNKTSTSLRSLEREIAALSEERETLKRKLDKMADYDEVRQELEMLKSIEFSTGDVDDSDTEDTPPDINSSADTHGKPESLEKLLLARNKKLGDELTILRVSHNDLQSRLESLQEELSNTNMDLERSRNLNAQLENDLHATQQEALNAFDPSAMSVAGTYTSRYPKSSYAASTRRGLATSPTSSIISGFDASSSSRPFDSLRSSGDNNSTTPASGILPMVTAQRDRFKQKIADLEAEHQKQYAVITELRSEIASLQKDNLNLYEKTRYVNSYNRSGAVAAGPGASSSGAYATSASISLGAADAASDRYRSAYEANISPFAAFRGRESARALKRMSLPERAIFQVTRMVLATRTSRNLFAGYCVGLHLLVFVMLFSMGSSAGIGGGGGVHQVVGGAAAAAAAAGQVGSGSGGGGGSSGGSGLGAGSGTGAEWVKQEFHDR